MKSALFRAALISPEFRIPLAVTLILGAALLLPGVASGGGTGGSALVMIQGSGAARDLGDYVSAPTGLDTYYSYYIEATPTLAQLDIDLFDADIGAGGGGEAAANRDRARGTFTTTAAYSLRAPNGLVVSTRFATGSTTLPALGDNAWLTFFSSTGTFRDEFETVAYTNNNGTNTWSTDWIETGDDGTANGGEVRIVSDGGSNRLRVENASMTVEREANLNGMTSVTLTFVYRRSGLDNANDYVAIEASGNGGGAWTELARFAGPTNDAGYTAVSYNLTPYIATNTRIRFRSPATMGNNDLVFFDNVEISFSGPVAGHWELRVDQSNAVTTGDDINALGIRAHDGTPAAGGTEVNVYQHSFGTYGTNNPPDTRSYTHYPLVTSGCLAESNNFDWDSNSGATGSLTYTSRTATFAQTIGTLSGNDAWQNVNVGSWTDDLNADDYGIWSLGVTVNDYPGNANYGQVYMGNSSAVTPPTTQPQANTFRLYLPTDATTAPVKPYLEQLSRHSCGTGTGAGPNPPNTGQTSCFTVTVRFVNPTSRAVNFSTPTNIVTANVPGAGAVYGGGAQVSQGSILSQPAVGGTGNITWNPGTVAAGATVLLSYRVNVTPTSDGQRIPITATSAAVNATQAQFVDETANTTQTRATYLAGPLCELAATEDVVTAAVVSRLTAQAGPGGVVVEWETVSEVGTVGFDLLRWAPERKEYERVNRELLTALLDAPQGSRYRFVDSGADPAAPQRYLLVEVEASGDRRRHGPFRVRVAPEGIAKQADGDLSEYSREARERPTPKASPVKAAPRGPVLGGKAEAVKIGVETTGLYLVRTEDIAALLGQSPEKLVKVLEKGQLTLSNHGQDVAWTLAEGGAGVLFYGEAPEGLDGLYTRENVYRLSLGGRGSLQMAVAPGSAPAPASGLRFLDTVHAEMDRLPATVVTTEPDSDWWFWDYLNAGGASDGKRTFPVEAPDLSGTDGTARLRVTLHGATATGAADEHHAIVRVNGTEVGESRWSGLAESSFELDFSPSLLLPGANAVEVEAVLGSGVPYSIFYVDGFDLTYPRAYRAAGDALAFRGDGNAAVTVDGFADARISVLDVTDPRTPRLLSGVALDGAPGDYRATLSPSSGADYMAVSPAGWKAPRSLRGDVPSSLQSRQGADYLVLTTGDLLAPARELAALRQRQGLRTLVVDVEDVYDEFNFGLASPQAIRDFLASLKGTWSPVPGFVVLAGAGTYDYRDNLGFGGNLLPPLLVSTADGLFASDNRFADVAGADGVPEMAIGRLPVRTAAELSAYVQKIAAYEAAAPAEWSGKALLVTDNAEGGVDFQAEGAELATALPGGYAVESLNFAGGSADAARADLVSRLTAGVGLLGYVGHGALDRLAAEGLLQAGDVAGLANGSRLPVVTALTCIINRFELPYFPPLGADLVRKAGGGAAAVWAPSGLSFSNESQALGERFFRELGRPGGERVGEAIRRSLAAYAGAGGLPGVSDLYNLLGDPALRVKGPAPVPEPGGGTPGVE